MCGPLWVRVQGKKLGVEDCCVHAYFSPVGAVTSFVFLELSLRKLSHIPRQNESRPSSTSAWNGPHRVSSLVVTKCFCWAANMHDEAPSGAMESVCQALWGNPACCHAWTLQPPHQQPWSWHCAMAGLCWAVNVRQLFSCQADPASSFCLFIS